MTNQDFHYKEALRLSPLRKYAPVALLALNGLLVAVTVILPLLEEAPPSHNPWTWIGLMVTYLALLALGIFIYRFIHDMDTAQRDATADLNMLFVTNQHLNTILRSIEDGVITTNVDGQVSMMNAVAETLTGWPQARALGTPLPRVFQLLNEASRLEEPSPFARVVATGARIPASVSSILVSLEGVESPVEWIATPLLSNENKVIGSVVVFRDATAQRLAQRQRDDLIQQLLESNEKLRREIAKSDESRRAALNLMQDAQMAQKALEISEEKLRESNASLEEYAYVASHDLQEPLRKIENFIQIFLEDYSSHVDERGKQYLATISKAAGRMRKLIKDVLQFAEAGASEKPFSEVSLTRVLHAARDNISEILKEKKGELIIHRLPAIQGDENQLVRVFQNLLSNSLKFNDKRVPRIEVDAKEEGSFWKIQIADNGIGMNPLEMTKLFAPFKRLHGRDRYEGTGIGLAVCRKIITRHGGSIGVDSIQGKGSTFWLMIPKSEAESASMLNSGSKRR
ncbi:MAG: ATP-binding protein [Lentisphaerota bacterium]